MTLVASPIANWPMRPSGDGFRGDCPVCGGKDTFMLKPGRVLWIPRCFRCDDFEALLKLVKGERVGSLNYIKPSMPDPERVERARKAINRVWREASVLTGDCPASLYLLKTRGLEIPQGCSALRFHPNLRTRLDDDGEFVTMPGMVAALTNIHGQLLSVHRTLLSTNSDGDFVKFKRMLMMSPIDGITRGASIQVVPLDGDTLGVAEGIETALACHAATGIPVWSAISAGGMESMDIPQSIRHLVIFADNDAHERGAVAAERLQRRVIRQGIGVKVVMPECSGSDWDDYLKAVCT